MSRGAKFRSGLTFRNAVATLALFLALGGGSALALSGQNSVRSDDIVNGQVRKADLGANSVDSSAAKNGALKPRDTDRLIANAQGGPVVTSNVQLPLALSGGTWNQAKGELELLSGSATFTRPLNCGAFGFGSVALYLDGQSWASATANQADVGPGQTVTKPISIAPLRTLAVAKSHTLTAQISGNCQNAAQHYTVDLVRANVMGIR